MKNPSSFNDCIRIVSFSDASNLKTVLKKAKTPESADVYLNASSENWQTICCMTVSVKFLINYAHPQQVNSQQLSHLNIPQPMLAPADTQRMASNL